MSIMNTNTNDEQAKLWNTLAGQAWVQEQEVLDRLYKPFEDLLVDAVTAAGPRRRVLDVGCGTGATTVAIARRLGPAARCVGVDISEPMIAAAHARAERDRVPADFIRANVQDHAFEPASFDTIVSRFGVMFFDDPIAAFANLRRAATDDAVLRAITWRGPEENPFMTTAERAAAPLLPMLPTRRPDAPGQFGFANAQRVSSILRESGWADVDIQPIDVQCTMPEPALISYLTKFGPVGRVFPELDAPTRAQVIALVRAAFDPYVHGTDVRFIAACWMTGARGTR
jgi:SAM-dependent methyltransferase